MVPCSISILHSKAYNIYASQWTVTDIRSLCHQHDLFLILIGRHTCRYVTMALSSLVRQAFSDVYDPFGRLQSPHTYFASDLPANCAYAKQGYNSSASPISEWITGLSLLTSFLHSPGAASNNGTLKFMTTVFSGLSVRDMEVHSWCLVLLRLT